MRDNSGSFRRNERKEKQTHPDYKGKATVAGVEYWLSGWIKKGEDGSWMSLAFTPKDEEQKSKRVSHGDDTPDSDIPF